MINMKLTKEQIRFLSNEKKNIAALRKLQDQSFNKCLKELKLKDGTGLAEYLWDYLFITDISVKDLQKGIDKTVKSGDTGNCDAGCGCKH